MNSVVKPMMLLLENQLDSGVFDFPDLLFLFATWL